MTRESSREIAALFILVLSAFVAICLYSEPLPVAKATTDIGRNACGPVGSALSNWLTGWFGKVGAYGLCAIVGLVGGVLFFRRTIKQWGWKLVGAALVMLALCAFEAAAFNESGTPRHLPGGFVGFYLFDFLFSNVSTVGTYLLLGLVVAVAFLISTDTVFYPAFAHTQKIVFDGARWSSWASSVRDATDRIVQRTGGRTSGSGKAKLKKKKRFKIFSLSDYLNGRTGTKKKTQKKAKKKTATKKTAKADTKTTAKSTKTKTKTKTKAKAKDDVETTLEEELDEALAQTTTAKTTSRKASEQSKAPAEELVEEEEYEEDELEEEEYEEEEGEEYEDEEEEEEEEDDEEYEDEEDDEEYEDEEEEEYEEEEEEEEPEAEEDTRPPLKIKLPEPVVPSPPVKKTAKAKKDGPYHMPPLSLIESTPNIVDSMDRDSLERTANKIEATLRDFKIDARVVEVQKGPTVTQFEISLAAGIKVHKIVNLSDDLAMALKAQGIRIIAPIPGKSTVGLEVPNPKRATVGLRELIEFAQSKSDNAKLPLALGRDTSGSPVIGDLGEMPHLLIAGSTGSGKSVCINSIITNLLVTRTPDEVKMILVDPKMVELAQFDNIPHLMCPVVTDMKKAPAVLNWLVDKMEERYELLAMAGVRHIGSFNSLGKEKLRERLENKLDPESLEETPDFLPFIVVIIDELADLMMTASKEVEGSITRLSQKSRAVGIHVILATQRPSVDVITGLIKANMPSRVSFRVASRVDSRTILDRNGAEKLLGKGDMLYLPPGTSEVERVQGTFISDKEIRDVVEAAKKEAEPRFNAELTRFGVEGAADSSDQDELYDKAVEIVLGSQRGSVTLLQRQLQIGYTRASRLMELMHEQGLVGPFKGSKAREVYYTLEEFQKARERAAAQAGGEAEESEEPEEPDVDEPEAELDEDTELATSEE